MRTLLALDLGTTAGWASSNEDGIKSGSQCFKSCRFENWGMRFVQFKKWLTETKQGLKHIDLLYFEEVRRHSSVAAAHVYGGFMGMLTTWCEHHQISYQSVPVGTIKKFLTGKGNASKEEMIQGVQALGHHPMDDNEADALALLYWAREQESSS